MGYRKLLIPDASIQNVGFVYDFNSSKFYLSDFQTEKAANHFITVLED